MLDVTETIRVNVEGNQINHGIFRDFPTDLRARRAARAQSGFDVASVERDGRPEPYETSRFGNGVRVQIGDGDVYLDHGEHTHVIRYTHHAPARLLRRLRRALLERHRQRLGLPDRPRRSAYPPAASPVPFGRERALYTGPQGSTARNAEVVSEQPGDILIRSTVPLAPVRRA